MSVPLIGQKSDQEMRNHAWEAHYNAVGSFMGPLVAVIEGGVTAVVAAIRRNHTDDDAASSVAWAREILEEVVAPTPSSAKDDAQMELPFGDDADA